MPFCNISKDVSLHYITNSPNGDTTGFDYTKPTILLLPPLFCDVTWLREQFGDPRLSESYNLIAFDPRNMGMTKADANPRRDLWVDAADIAVAHELLQLPPCHVFAVAMNSCGVALRLVTLFPTKCLSLCLCGAPVQAGEDPDWVVQGYREATYTWCFPRDMEDLERTCMEHSWLLFNGQISPELEDEIIAWWQTHIPATKRTHFLAHALCAMKRTRLSEQELLSIKQPALFIQGDKSQINPPNKAQELSKRMPDCKIFVVKGGPELMSIIPEYASVVNRVYCQFLRGLPHPPVFHAPPPDPEGVCKAGLERLATFQADALIAERDPTSTLSFCLYSPAVIDQNTKMLAEFVEGEDQAFCALDEHGQPIRKFSERHVDEWKPATFFRMQDHIAAGGAMVTVSQTFSVSDVTHEEDERGSPE